MERVVKLTDQNMVDNLSRLSVEVEARKNLISFMIASQMDISTPQFEKYQQEYLEYFAEYSMAKNVLENFIKESLSPSEKLISWALDFQTSNLTLQINNE